MFLLLLSFNLLFPLRKYSTTNSCTDQALERRKRCTTRKPVFHRINLPWAFTNAQLPALTHCQSDSSYEKTTQAPVPLRYAAASILPGCNTKLIVMKAPRRFISLMFSCVLLLHAAAMKKDFALYFEQRIQGESTLRVTATYYVKSGDADSKKAAGFATKFWNDKSGKFKATMGNGFQLTDYILYFDLKVIEVSDPEAEMRKDKTGRNDAITPDGSSNSFTVLHNAGLGKSAGKTFCCNIIKIKGDMKDDPQVGPHEVGHTLLINHAGPLSKSVMADGATGTTLVLAKDVQQIINGAFNTPTPHRITIHGGPSLAFGEDKMKVVCKIRNRTKQTPLRSFALLSD